MHICCNMKSLEEKNSKGKERKVVGRKEGISVESATLANIVKDGT